MKSVLCASIRISTMFWQGVWSVQKTDDPVDHWKILLSTKCFHVPYSALTMFLSTEQKERDSATAYRMTVEVLGTLIGAAIQGQIVASAHASKHCTLQNASAVSPLNRSYVSSSTEGSISPYSQPQGFLSHAKQVYMIAAGVIGSVYLICTVVLFLGVKERDDPYALKSDKPIPFLKGFKLVMKHGPYLKLTAAFLFISVAVQLAQSNFVLFCTYAVDLREHFQNIVLTLLISAVVSIPLWQWFLQRFGKKTAAYCGISWIIPFIIMLVYIPSLLVAYVVAVSSGLSVAATLLLPWFAGYDTRACKQPPPVAHVLKLLIGAAPVILIVTGLLILIFYPITEDMRTKNKQALNQLRIHHYSLEGPLEDV
nr:PREDICTED: major facilitator superfamily domain-containing protein 2B [Latimeria chalumnae]|eukprot:XP_006000108.2 PREDICTED: major facilitator superfamily domain-containing protein 2B [Latimeria chalumnae]